MYVFLFSDADWLWNGSHYVQVSTGEWKLVSVNESFPLSLSLSSLSLSPSLPPLPPSSLPSFLFPPPPPPHLSLSLSPFIIIIIIIISYRRTLLLVFKSYWLDYLIKWRKQLRKWLSNVSINIINATHVHFTCKCICFGTCTCEWDIVLVFIVHALLNKC